MARHPVMPTRLAWSCFRALRHQLWSDAHLHSSVERTAIFLDRHRRQAPMRRTFATCIRRGVLKRERGDKLTARWLRENFEQPENLGCVTDFFRARSGFLYQSSSLCCSSWMNPPDWTPRLKGSLSFPNIVWTHESSIFCKMSVEMFDVGVRARMERKGQKNR